MNFPVGSLALLLITVVSGCGSTETVADRIAGDPDRFDHYPLDIQEKIRGGQVDIGFTFDMVRFAAGEPDGVSTYARRDAPTRTVWVYRGYTFRRDRVSYGGYGYGFHHFHSPFRHDSHHGCYSHHGFGTPVWIDVRVAHERLRVEFQGDSVVAVARHDR